MMKAQRNRHVHLPVGTAICIGLLACWMGRAVPGTWLVAHAQSAEQIAEIAAANLRKAERIKKAGQVPAPALLEFDQQGNLVQAWGLPGQGGWTKGKDRPFPAQAMNIDWKGNVWVTEESRGHEVVKFTRDGKFLLQIGQVDKTNGSNDTTLLGAPSGIDFDPAANEVYIADGYYVNQRVIVFDADT